MLVSLAGFGQIQSIHTLVGSNNPNSALTKRGLDGSLSWTASGTNTYTVSIGLGVTALADGDIIKVHFPNANSSTTVTVNPNSIGAIAVKDNAGNDPAVGDIKAGGTYILRYNGTHFRVLNLGAGGGVTAGDKGDITVTLGPEAWTIDNGAVTGGKLGTTSSAQLATALSDEQGSSGGFTRTDYVDGKVVDGTITNGVTTSAPSQDDVFDALALKADLGNIPLIVYVTDVFTNIGAGTGKMYVPIKTARTITSVTAYLITAQASGSIFTVDINENGSSILSPKLTIDNTETNSTTAATAAVIVDNSLAANSILSFDVDQIGNGTAIGLIVIIE